MLRIQRRHTERLIRRLQQFAPLGPDEKAAVVAAMNGVRHFDYREDVIRQGSRPEGVFIILDGFACRYKMLPDGRRHIVGYLVPGDLCDLRVFLLKHMDHSIAALSPLETTMLPPADVMALLDGFPRLARALWWTTLVEECITREWIVNVGHRSALERIAHLFCEVFCRLEAVGLTRGNECHLPLTQIELADSVALSAVHVNRTLMYLRRRNLAKFGDETLTLLDRSALQTAAGFDPRYLHLEGGNTTSGGSSRRRRARA